MGQRWIWLSKMPLFPRVPLEKRRLYSLLFYDIISIMEDKIDNNKAAGLVWYVIGLIALTHVWRTTGTLPSDFLLGALSVWCLRNGMVYYDIVKEEENERRK